MQAHQLQDEVGFSVALGSGPYPLLEHAECCEVSRAACEQVRTPVARNLGSPCGWGDVDGQRLLSARIAEVTGVAHASPHAFWIVEGRAVWHASHAGITQAALAPATATTSAQST